MTTRPSEMQMQLLTTHAHLHTLSLRAATVPGPGKAGDDPFNHREFHAFMEMCTYLVQVPSKPTVVILENTDGMDKKAAL